MVVPESEKFSDNELIVLYKFCVLLTLNYILFHLNSKISFGLFDRGVTIAMNFLT